jgi:hypothetical protein
MRGAQLNEDELDAAEKRAVEKYDGNFGCDALRKQLDLPTALEQVQEVIENSDL